jgi:hypothetical protein
LLAPFHQTDLLAIKFLETTSCVETACGEPFYTSALVARGSSSMSG